MAEGTRRRDRAVGRTNARAAAWLAWSLAALSVAMFLAGAALTALSSSDTPVARTSSDWGTASALGGLVIFLPFLAFPLVGALAASRRPRNPIGWISLAAGLFWMLIVLDDSLPSDFGPYPVTIDALTQWMWVPPVGLLGIYMILLFPNGRLPSRRWRPLGWLSGVVMVLAGVVLTISPGDLPGHPGVRNPFGLEGYPMAAQVLPSVVALLPVCILASAASLVWRYRHSGGEVRQQIKWVAFAASFVGLAYGITLVAGLFLAPEALASERGPSWMSLLQNAVLMSYTGVPIAVGVAVLKYRLYDIDLIINRALVYVFLTVLLAAAYVGGVVGMQAALRALTGQESTLAVVASTLAIAALFGPLRRRVQGFVDRRFYRREDHRRIQRPDARRDRFGRPVRRPGGGGRRERAAGARLPVAASREGLRGRNKGLAVPYSPNLVEGAFCEVRTAPVLRWGVSYVQNGADTSGVHKNHVIPPGGVMAPPDNPFTSSMCVRHTISL